MGLDDIDDYHYDHNSGNDKEELDTRKFHGDAVEPDIDYDYDDEESKGIRFHCANKNYNSVYDHCHYTGKYRRVAHSICNLRNSFGH